MPSPLGVFMAALMAVDRFIRLHFLGFTVLLLLLGAGSVTPSPDGGSLLLLLAIGTCFHTFAYVFNDVIDLPVDRTHPDRQQDFLVRGVIAPWQALTFSLLQIPLAVGLGLWADVGGPALLCLLCGFALMAVYDLWGKRCPIPPLTDLAQGLAWGSLAIFAALATGYTPNLLTWVGALHGVTFIFLINGVHGGLRDLDNDLARGRLTTASYFGARPRHEQAPLRASLKIFAMSIQLSMLVIHLLPLLYGVMDLSGPALWSLAAVVLGLDLLCVWYMRRVFQVHSPSWGRDFRIHLGLLQLPPMVLFSAQLSLGPTLLMFAAMLWALLFLEVTRDVLFRPLKRWLHVRP